MSHLPPAYPQAWVKIVRITDDLQVTVRPIHPGDVKLLQQAFSQLSPESRYLRFLDVSLQLSEKRARALATVDYLTGMAFAAILTTDGHERIIGVSRYAVIDQNQPGIAEGAIVVLDEFQNLGVGRVLMDCLIQYGLEKGIHTLVANFHVSNLKILHLIQSSGMPYQKDILEPGVWTVQLFIKPEGQKLGS